MKGFLFTALACASALSGAFASPVAGSGHGSDAGHHNDGGHGNGNGRGDSGYWHHERDEEASSSATTSSSSSSKRCTKPAVRKEWRSLTTKEKKSYIKAVQCLASLPSQAKSSIPGAVTRYDDFQGVHSSQTASIHWVGHFALWHRRFTAAYETALRTECGWTSGQPYWDWLLDTDTDTDTDSPTPPLPMQSWPIFNPTTGFGGNGPFVSITPEQNILNITDRTGGGCVSDGPFTRANGFTINLGPTTDYTITNPRCLTRDFAPVIAATNLVRSVWDQVMAQSTYGAFVRRLEGEPTFDVKNVHGGGHFGVGGVLGGIGDPYNSPSDPLFYLHHANLDRLLWEWQARDLNTRLRDVSGPIVPFDYDNVAAGNVTLGFKINLGPLGEDTELSELLNIVGGTLCYTYD